MAVARKSWRRRSRRCALDVSVVSGTRSRGTNGHEHRARDYLKEQLSVFGLRGERCVCRGSVLNARHGAPSGSSCRTRAKLPENQLSNYRSRSRRYPRKLARILLAVAANDLARTSRDFVIRSRVPLLRRSASSLGPRAIPDARTTAAKHGECAASENVIDRRRLYAILLTSSERARARARVLASQSVSARSTTTRLPARLSFILNITVYK